MKGLVLFLGLILLLNLVSATEIGISPSKLEFSGKNGEVICRNFELITKDKEYLRGEDRWSSEDSRKLEDYNLRADELGIEIDYTNSIEFKGRQIIEVCLQTLDSGVYYGALIYKTDSAGVGTWLKVNISREFIENGVSRTSMTGMSVFEEGSSLAVFSVLEIIFLVIIFLVLIYILKSNKLFKYRE